VRIFNLLLTIFYYEGNFEEAFRYAREHGIKPFDLIRTAQQMLDHAPEDVGRLIDDFVRESREELFDSREECVAWAEERLPQLLSGELGGNLLSKYSMMARFFVTQETVSFLEMALDSALGEPVRGSTREELAAVIGYLRTVLLHVPFRDVMRRTDMFTSVYDVEAWRTSQDGRPLSAFRASEPIAWHTSMDPEWRAIFEHRLATFGESPATIGKFTRTVFANHLRRALVRGHESVSESR
jgi:hypothetical protein